MDARARRFAVVTCCALASLAADCMADDSLAEPSLDDVAGEWHATYIIEGSTGSNYIDQGWVIEMTLHDDGTTDGTFSAPGAGEPDEDEDFEADLTGTWELVEYEVTFDHAADTFLRDMTFEWTDPGTLTAYAEGDGITMVVLTQD